MKTTITLRPGKYNSNDYRLGLRTEDFKKYVNKDVSDVLIDFGDGVKHKVGSNKTYVNHGSLTNKRIISTWLLDNRFTSPEIQLEFELEIYNNTHIYTRRKTENPKQEYTKKTIDTTMMDNNTNILTIRLNVREHILKYANKISKEPEPVMNWRYANNGAEFKTIIEGADLSSDFKKVINQIENPLSRDAVTSYYDINGIIEENEINDRLYKAFWATILWGGKHNGRPAEKRGFSKLVKESKASISAKMLNVYNILNNPLKKDRDKIKEAYSSFQDRNRNKIEGLGDAYFTKILFFMSKKIKLSPQPLILDSRMKAIHYDLLSDNVEQQLKYYTWDGVNIINAMPDAYLDYCDKMKILSSSISTTPEQLELYLFNRLRPVNMIIIWNNMDNII